MVVVGLKSRTRLRIGHATLNTRPHSITEDEHNWPEYFKMAKQQGISRLGYQAWYYFEARLILGQLRRGGGGSCTSFEGRTHFERSKVVLSKPTKTEREGACKFGYYVLILSAYDSTNKARL